MNKFINNFYKIITILFAILTIYEMFIYMNNNASYFGLFYLFLNFFIMFLLITIAYNFKTSNKKIRFSKNMIVIIIGIISSFILTLILPYIFNYSDEAYLYNEKIYIISKIIKPIIYLTIGIISIVEIKKTKIKHIK